MQKKLIIDRTHLVLLSGKLELQKKLCKQSGASLRCPELFQSQWEQFKRVMTKLVPIKNASDPDNQLTLITLIYLIVIFFKFYYIF